MYLKIFIGIPSKYYFCYILYTLLKLITNTRKKCPSIHRFSSLLSTYYTTFVVRSIAGIKNNYWNYLIKKDRNLLNN